MEKITIRILAVGKDWLVRYPDDRQVIYRTKAAALQGAIGEISTGEYLQVELRIPASWLRNRNRAERVH
jgi:hypothetical protein